MEKTNSAKKILLGIAAAAVLLLGIYMILPGFTRITSVYISDYSLSDDGSEITINVSVTSSVGFVRKVAVHQQEGGKLYLDCYAAFGGINGSIGAKSKHTIKLDEDTEIIAIYKNNNCYEEVLRKDENGNWQRV